MKKGILLFISIIITTQLFSQEKIKGNRYVTINKTTINAFKKIVLSDDFKILLIESDISSVEIETDDNLHAVIQFKVVDSTLTFKKTKKIKSKRRLNITVFYTEKLNEIILKNDAEIEHLKTIEVNNLLLKINDYAIADLHVKSNTFKLVNNNKSRMQLRSKSKLTIESPNIDLILNKTSNTFLNIKTDSLKVNMNERSTTEIEGFSNVLSASINESGDFSGKNLKVKNTVLNSSGTSDFSIHASENITIDSSDKSKIDLYGNPKILITKFANFSKLNKKELPKK